MLLKSSRRDRKAARAGSSSDVSVSCLIDRDGAQSAHFTEFAGHVPWGHDSVRLSSSYQWLFTDRGIYRPGETMHVKGIVRVSGPFTVEAVQPPEMSLGDIMATGRAGLGMTDAGFDGAPEEVEPTFAMRPVETGVAAARAGHIGNYAYLHGGQYSAKA